MDRQYSFENFFSTGSAFIVEQLKTAINGSGERQIGLFGGNSSGKTHLLNAAAYVAGQQKYNFQIYDAMQLAQCDADAFGGFDHCQLLLIDNLDAIAGLPGWEKCFYRVINECRSGRLSFIYSLSINPQNLQTRLDDFRSRLQWGLLLTLSDYDEDEIKHILKQRAQLLGLELTKEVLAYLMTHYPRNLNSQMTILRILDSASLIRQRKITVPLVKQALQGEVSL